MSLLVALIIAAAVLVIVLFAIAFVLNNQRREAQSGSFTHDVEAADRMLAAALASDKGWHISNLETAARAALAEQRPGWEYQSLELVLVDDRPGMAEDRAEMAAIGAGERVIVPLARSESGEWSAGGLA